MRPLLAEPQTPSSGTDEESRLDGRVARDASRVNRRLAQTFESDLSAASASSAFGEQWAVPKTRWGIGLYLSHSPAILQWDRRWYICDLLEETVTVRTERYFPRITYG